MIRITTALLVALLVVGCGGKSAQQGMHAEESIPGGPLRLVIMGPPGAGKGTQANKIREQYGIPHISTGAILRDEVARGTELGRRVEGVMERGELVSDNIVLRLVQDRIGQPDCAAGFILDGFPRTIEQAERLETIMRHKQMGSIRVLNLNVPDDELTRRLMARKRADDTEKTISNRIHIYHAVTAPLIDYYKSRGVLVNIDGNGSIEDVFADIRAVLDR